MLPRLVLWRGTDDEWRTEGASVDLTGNGVRATGVQLGIEPIPYRLDYELDASDGFLTRRIVARASGSGWARRVELRHDGKGAWTCTSEHEGDVDLAAPGADVAVLVGALDCDLGFSPLTNLMPIRRHRLHEEPGAHDFLMAWVSVPDLEVCASAQRYEHVRTNESGAVVRYIDRGRYAGFTANLELDADGLVVTYPELASRVG